MKYHVPARQRHRKSILTSQYYQDRSFSTHKCRKWRKERGVGRIHPERYVHSYEGSINQDTQPSDGDYLTYPSFLYRNEDNNGEPKRTSSPSIVSTVARYLGINL